MELSLVFGMVFAMEELPFSNILVEQIEGKGKGKGYQAGNEVATPDWSACK
jgi:hypothetical protein